MKRKLLSVMICATLMLVPCNTALAEDSETDVEDLKSRIAELEEKVQALEEEFDALLNGGGITLTFGDETGDETNSDTGSEGKETVPEFNLGETWTVKGEWEITVESVEETSYRDEDSDMNPAAVYIVTYNYTNLGYDLDEWGLYIGLDDGIVDSEGYMGYSYFVDTPYFPTDVPVGATCKAQVGIGVDNPGDFKINYTAFDDNDEVHSAVFIIPVD